MHGRYGKKECSVTKDVVTSMQIVLDAFVIIEENGYGELEYDDSNLVSISQENQIQVPPPKSREKLCDFLMTLARKDVFPKEDLRKLWVKKKAERTKALKEWRDAKSRLKYWTAKARASEDKVNQCDQELLKTLK